MISQQRWGGGVRPIAQRIIGGRPAAQSSLFLATYIDKHLYEETMNIVELFQFASLKAWETFAGLWPLLLLSILISVLIKLYTNQEQVGRFLRRNSRNG